jgi:hypothetical protein
MKLVSFRAHEIDEILHGAGFARDPVGVHLCLEKEPLHGLIGLLQLERRLIAGSDGMTP